MDIVPPEVAIVAAPPAGPKSAEVVIDRFPFVSVCTDPFANVSEVGALTSTVLPAPGVNWPVPAMPRELVLCTAIEVALVAEPTYWTDPLFTNVPLLTLKVIPESDESVTPVSIVVGASGVRLLAVAVTTGPPFRSNVVGAPGVDDANVSGTSTAGHVSGPGGLPIEGAMRMVPPAVGSVAEELAGNETVSGLPDESTMAYPDVLSLTTDEPAPRFIVAAAKVTGA